MNMRLVPLMFVTCFEFVFCSQAETNVRPSPEGDRSLKSHLWRIASKHDCYFTIEMMGLSSDELSRRLQELSNNISNNKVTTLLDSFLFNSALASIKTGNGTLDEELNTLGNLVPHFAYKINAKNAKIIHVHDLRLKEIKSYPLDHPIPNGFEFSGSILELQGSLRKLIPGLWSSLGIGNNRIIVDGITQVAVKTKENYTAREVLSNFIPLFNYSRILWMASAKLEENVHVEVAFPGGIDKRSAWDERSAEHPVIDFSEGGAQYARAISQRDDIVKAAIEYIDLNKIEGRQPRFAIRLLGDFRAVEAIPTILSNLTYKYCNIDLIEEAYPAAYGLRLIGRDTIEPLLTDMLSRQQLPPDYFRVAAYVMQSILGEIGAKEYTSEKLKAATGQETARLQGLLNVIELYGERSGLGAERKVQGR